MKPDFFAGKVKIDDNRKYEYDNNLIMISTRSLLFINRVWNGSYFVQTSKAEIFLYNPILF